MYTIYGLSNCDSVRKVIKWMDEQKKSFRLHDFRKDGVCTELVQNWLEQVSLETLLNKKSTTWRELADQDKMAASSLPHALSLMVKNPTLIKRPVVEKEGKVIAVGLPGVING